MKKYDISSSIVLLVLGILLLVVPLGIVTTLIRLFGLVILILGVLSILSEVKAKRSSTDLVNGILIGILGLIFLSNPNTIASIIPFILGIWISIKSLIKLKFINSFRGIGSEHVKPLVINIITLILGLILVFNPFKGAKALIRIVGGFMAFYGLLDVLDYISTRPKKVKVIK